MAILSIESRMKPEDWAKTTYFKNYQHEAWGDPAMIRKELAFAIDALRGYVGAPFVVHCAYELSGHSKVPPSQHGYGNAVDGHFQKITFQEAVRRVEAGVAALGLAKACGIGIYPAWYTPGFHFDMRGPAYAAAHGNVPARWAWTGQKNARGENIYVGWLAGMAWAQQHGKLQWADPGRR